MKYQKNTTKQFRDSCKLLKKDIYMYIYIYIYICLQEKRQKIIDNLRWVIIV